MDDSQILQQVSEKELRLERLFAAPPETVFEYWTKPELLASWFGPDGCDVPEYEIEPREGGAWTITVITADCARHKVSGVWKVIERPARLVFTWAWHNDDGQRGHETEVTVTFAAAPGGTRLVLVQRAFENSDMAGKHGFGWSSSFISLDKVLS